MKRKLFSVFFTALFTCIALSASAQPGVDTVWTRNGTVGINLSQASFSNWAAGGDNAIGFNSFLNYSANYKKLKNIWQNRLELAYGLNKTKSDGTRKTNDRIYLSSLYGYEVGKNLYLSAFMNFQTQFDKGYDYSISDEDFISRFMSPGYLTTGLGLTWTPKRWFTVTLSPATWKGTFVTSDYLSNQGAYGVDPGDHLLSEFGANLLAEVNYEFLKNMKIYSRLNLYSNYLDQPQNIDVQWDVQLNMAINQWFSTIITTNLIYDNDTKIAQKDGTKKPMVQFKEVLGVGFQVNF